MTVSFETDSKRNRYPWYPIIMMSVLTVLTFTWAGWFLSHVEPTWKTTQRDINRQLKQQEPTTATIVLDRWRVIQVFIPPEVVASSGGDAVILTGPRDIIVKLHRKAWNLDE